MNSKKRIARNMLSNTLIYTQAKDGHDNNKSNPVCGNQFAETFDAYIAEFLFGNDITDWTLIPDEYVLDDVNSNNFEYYIKWDKEKLHSK